MKKIIKNILLKTNKNSLKELIKSLNSHNININPIDILKIIEFLIKNNYFNYEIVNNKLIKTNKTINKNQILILTEPKMTNEIKTNLIMLKIIVAKDAENEYIFHNYFDYLFDDYMENISIGNPFSKLKIHFDKSLYERFINILFYDFYIFHKFIDKRVMVLIYDILTRDNRIKKHIRDLHEERFYEFLFEKSPKRWLYLNYLKIAMNSIGYDKSNIQKLIKSTHNNYYHKFKLIIFYDALILFDFKKELNEILKIGLNNLDSYKILIGNETYNIIDFLNKHTDLLNYVCNDNYFKKLWINLYNKFKNKLASYNCYKYFSLNDILSFE